MRRLLGVLSVAALTAGAVMAAQSTKPQLAGPAVGRRLALAPAAAVPVCPGPETLVAPIGAAPVPAPGRVVVGALVAPPSLVAAPSLVDARPAAGGTGGGIAIATGVPIATLTVMHAGLVGPAVTPSDGLAAAEGGAAIHTSHRTAAGPVRLDARQVGTVPSVSAVQVTVGRGGDLRGLVAVECPVAVVDQWLVGGSTLTGRRGRLLLANPTSTPAVVDVVVHGPTGPVNATTGSGILVPPGAEKALFVDAIAPGLSAVAVHVRARVGRVVAVLHDSLVRGLVAGGADDVVGGVPADVRQVVPGLAIVRPGGGAVSPDLPADPTAPGATAVRIAVPGGGDAVVRVRLVGPVGAVDLPGGGVVTVPGGGVTDVAVAGVPDGVYAAVIEADVPVVAGAIIGRAVAGSERAGTRAGVATAVPPAELAWAASAAVLRGTSAVALPSLPTNARAGLRPLTVSLALSAPDAAGRVLLAEVGADGLLGAVSEVDIPAGSTVSVPISASASGMLLRPGPTADSTGSGHAGPVVAGVVLSARDSSGPMLAVMTVRPPLVGAGVAPRILSDSRLGL